jgi:aspartate/methionine/tyrosine aminotransferase
MEKRLTTMEGVYPNHPTALYWMFPNIADFGVTSQKLSEYLMKEEKVYVRPGTWYGKNGEGHFRLSFCVSWDWIQEGMDKMERGLKKFTK